MTYTATATIVIHTSAAKVWEALTTPEIVKQFMFGSEVVSDWQKGSSILYKGEWEGKAYEDKGTILEIEPEKLLKMTYYSPLSGKLDVPENYQTITYALSETDGKTNVKVTQDNNADQAGAKQAEANWQVVLDGLKSVLETRS